MLDLKQSKIKFEFGYVNEDKNKVEPAETVKVKSILLEKSWQPEIGKYKPSKMLYQDGKDVAILILEKDVTTVMPSFPYPEVTPFNQSYNVSKSIEVYGYPSPMCVVATGQCLFRTPMNQEWAHFIHTAPTVKGNHNFIVSFCGCLIFIFYLCVLNRKKGFSGGPVYLENTNQIVAIDSCFDKNGDNAATLVRTKIIEMIDYAKELLHGESNVTQESDDNEPPKKRRKKDDAEKKNKRSVFAHIPIDSSKTKKHKK